MSTRRDFERVAVAAALAVPNSKLDTSTVRKPGSTLNVVMAMASALAEEVDARNAERIAGNVTGAATGEALDLAIDDRTYGKLPRKGASAATATIGLMRTGQGAAAIVATGEEIDMGGVTFTVDAPGVAFSAGEGGAGIVKPLKVTAAAAGVAGNVSTSVSTFKNPGGLQDTSFRVLQLSTPIGGDPVDTFASGGDEREKDPDYLARYQLYKKGQRRGLDLLAAGALSTPGIQSATAIEQTTLTGRVTGKVFLYVADVNGRAGKALRERVEVQLREYRLQGQEISVESAIPTLITIVLSFAVKVGYDVGSVQAQAKASAIAYTNALNPGNSWFRAGVAAKLSTIPGLVFSSAYPFGVSTPSADLIALPSTRFRTTSELVSTL